MKTYNLTFEQLHNLAIQNQMIIEHGHKIPHDEIPSFLLARYNEIDKILESTGWNNDYLNRFGK